MHAVGIVQHRQDQLAFVALPQGDEFWAGRAATKIKKFFLDDRTGMLPSLLYAQLKLELSDVGAPTVSTNQSNRSVRTCKHMCRMYWHQILH